MLIYGIILGIYQVPVVSGLMRGPFEYSTGEPVVFFIPGLSAGGLQP